MDVAYRCCKWTLFGYLQITDRTGDGLRRSNAPNMRHYYFSYQPDLF